MRSNFYFSWQSRNKSPVVECIVVTTVLFRKFSAALYIKRNATAIPAKTITVHTIRQAKLFWPSIFKASTLYPAPNLVQSVLSNLKLFFIQLREFCITLGDIASFLFQIYSAVHTATAHKESVIASLENVYEIQKRSIKIWIHFKNL